MLRVGLTGGIASGKSAVGNIFVVLGGYVVQADDIAHQLMLPGGEVYAEVVEHFGQAILNSDGSIHRGKLAEAAFGDPVTGQASRIAELNQIVHPAVVQKQEQWMRGIGRAYPEAVAIVEAALILEANMGRCFDRLVVVTCEPAQRIERWAQRKNVDLETARREVSRRMAAQLPDEKKIEAADYVIDNSGSIERTEKLAREVFLELQRDAKKAL